MALRRKLLASLLVTLSITGTAYAQDVSTWSTLCSSASRTSSLECRASHQVRAETGQVFLELSVVTQEGLPGGYLNLRAPLGFYLPSGLSTYSDGRELHSLDVERCDSSGCYGGVKLNQDQLEEFSQSAELSINFEIQDGKPISVEIEIDGLADAMSLIMQ